jgi:sugar lactone lactonase YvrE/5-hydroxyisourate hydrolase-like protein (transthyretin family)
MWQNTIDRFVCLLGARLRAFALIVLVLLLAAGSTFGIVQARPRTTTPTISLSTHRGPAGGNIAIVGSGFGATESVTISWVEQANNQQTQLGTTTTNSLGQFQTTVTTPASASFGEYTVQAVGQQSGDQATNSYYVGVVVECDNSNPCGTAVGNWTTRTSPSGYIGPNYVSAQGTGADTFTWAPSLPFVGNYEVYVRVVPSSGNSKVAPFTINYNGGSKTMLVDEQTPPAAFWLDMGNYSFVQGNSDTIQLTDATTDGGAVAADAVLLVNGTVVVSGTVLVNGQPPASPVTLTLWRLDGNTAYQVMTTQTGSGGAYAFTNVPADFLEYVGYYNAPPYNQNYLGYWNTASHTMASDYQEPTFDIGYSEQNNLSPINQVITMPMAAFPVQFSWNSYPSATSYTFEILQEPPNWQPGQPYNVYYVASDQQYPSQFQEPCSNNPQRICFNYEGGKNINGGGPLPIGSYLWGALFSNANGQGGVLDQPDGFAPRLVNISPSFGPAGEAVKINGVGFDTSNLSNDTVTFGTTQAAITSATPPYTLNVTVPTTLQPGPQTVTVTVATTNDPSKQQKLVSSNPQTFNVTTGTVTFLGQNLLRVPDGLTLDSQDNLYVSNFNAGVVAEITQSNRITRYTTVPSSSSTGPAGLTFSGSNLYIADYAPAPSGAIYMTPQGGGQATSCVSGLNNPALMATDSNGNVWVANYGPSDGSQSEVLEYAVNGSSCTLLQTIKLPGTNSYGADAIAFDSKGNVYVAAYQSGTIWTFPNVMNPQPVVYAQSPLLVTCDALAFDPSGNLWVTTYGVYNQANGAVYEVNPQGQLNPAPFAQNLQNPAAIQFDSSGAMYLVMTGATDVWKYVP